MAILLFISLLSRGDVIWSCTLCKIVKQIHRDRYKERLCVLTYIVSCIGTADIDTSLHTCILCMHVRHEFIHENIFRENYCMILRYMYVYAIRIHELMHGERKRE